MPDSENKSRHHLNGRISTSGFIYPSAEPHVHDPREAGLLLGPLGINAIDIHNWADFLLLPPAAQSCIRVTEKIILHWKLKGGMFLKGGGGPPGEDGKLSQMT